MNDSIIRWTNDDKQNLRKAVNNFNRKIKRLEQLGKDNLPEKVSYKELVGIKKLVDSSYDREIYSRRELNNVIRSLQRFSKRGAEDIVTLKSGEQVTKWQKREIGIARSRATKSINRRIGEIDTSWGMGNREIQELKGSLDSIRGIENKRGYEFRRALKSLENQARSDRELRLALNWKKNYLQRVESLQNFDNYDLFIIFLSKYKNPIKLYEQIEKSEILNDLFLWTDTDKILNPSTRTYGGFKSDQEAFNTALEQLGVLR